MGKPSSEPPSWTSARCLRLLRPLHAHLESLRRSNREDSEQKRSSERYHSLKRAYTSSFCSKTAASFDPEDPDWSSARARKRPRKTYSGRVSRPNREPSESDSAGGRGHCSWPHAVGVPFSLWDTRALSDVKLPPACLLRQADSYENSALVALEDRAALAKVSPQQLRLEAAFKTVLRETQKEQPAKTFAPSGDFARSAATAKSCGASSLTSLCARNVPKAIAWEVEQRRLKDLDDKTDVTFEVYNELEDLSATPTTGWPCLREVVRAHAVFAICQATRDGDLSDVSLRSLLEHAVAEGAYSEAEALLAVWIDVESTTPGFRTNTRIWKSSRTETVDKEPSCILELERYALKTSRYDFLFRRFGELLSRRRIHFDTLGIKRSKFLWSRAVQSLTEQPSRSSGAFYFAEQYFLDAANAGVHGLKHHDAALPNENSTQARQDTIISLGALITALDLHSLPAPGLISCFRAAMEGKVKGLRATEKDSTTASTILTASVLIAFELKSQGSGSPDADKDVVRYLSELLDQSRCSASHTKPGIEKPVPQTTRLCARFIVLFTRYAQTILPATPAFDRMQACVSSLVSFATQRPDENSRELRQTKFFAAQVALETVLQFSELEVTPKHTEFARHTEEQISQMGRSPRYAGVSTPQSTPRRDSSLETERDRSWTARHRMQRSPVYRWDDGLCEWITKTPLASKIGAQARSPHRLPDQATAGSRDKGLSPCRRRQPSAFKDLGPETHGRVSSPDIAGRASDSQDDTLEYETSLIASRASVETRLCSKLGLGVSNGETMRCKFEKLSDRELEEDELAYNLPDALPRPRRALGSVINDAWHTRHTLASKANVFSSDGVYDELA